MRTIGTVVSTVFVLFLSGCATIMTGAINSIPDPMYSFDLSSPVIVTVPSAANNALQSKYFIAKVVSALRNKGFSNVYTENDIGQAKDSLKVIFYVSVDKKTSTYTYRSADYGQVPDGSKTNCDGYNYGYSNTVNCTTTQKTKSGVIGYSDKTGYQTGLFFYLSAFDIKSQQQVLSVSAASLEDSCTDESVYDFLADESMTRMRFDQIIKQEFSVKMPKGYRCN